jgi:para-nitrobenzyl esterase
LAKDVGCHDAADLDCLRKVNASQLVVEYAGLKSTRAVVDGDVYTDFPIALIEKEEFNRVPFIMGNNAEEGNLFIYPPLSPTTPATAKQLQCMFFFTFGDDAHKISAVYPPVEAPGIDNRPMLSELVSDLVFHCDNNQVAQALANKGAAPWLYSFRHRPACNVLGFGAAHGSEIAYVFQNFAEVYAEFNSTCTPSPEDFALSARMASLWASFARTGIPDTQWKRTTAKDSVVLKLEASTVNRMDFETGYRASQCKVLDSILDTDEKYAPAITRLFDSITVCQEEVDKAFVV